MTRRLSASRGDRTKTRRTKTDQDELRRKAILQMIRRANDKAILHYVRNSTALSAKGKS